MMSSRRTIEKINLLIIGAQKSGTTTLYQILANQPSIWMSKKIKEPGFFLPFETVRQYYLKRNFDIKDKKDLYFNYIMPGYNGEKWIGEASTFYATLEWGTTRFVRLVQNYNPAIKIIYIVRDPAERIIAHYHHAKKKINDLSFNEFLSKTAEAVGITQYARRINPYEEIFGRKNILVLQFEKLLIEQNQVENSIAKFLNIRFKHQRKLPHLNKRRSVKNQPDSRLNDTIMNHKDWNDIVDESRILAAAYPNIDLNLWPSI